MKVRKTTLSKEVVVVEEQEGIVIELTRQEAAALFAVLSRISGSSEKKNLRDDCCSELWDKINEQFKFFSARNTPSYSDDVRPYINSIKTGMEIKTP